MSRTIEVELKFEVLDAGKLTNFLKAFKFKEQKGIVDIYLDTLDGTLFQRGIFIRVRNGSKFDIKYNKEDIQKDLDQKIEHNYCDEISYSLPLSADKLEAINDTLVELGMTKISKANIDELKNRNNLIESIIIDKHRMSYTGKGYKLDIDNVKDLGEYLEIEKMTDENDNPDEIIMEMKSLLKGLPLRHVDVGYNELYWRKHNFELYLKGKYLLIDDRKKYRQHTL